MAEDRAPSRIDYPTGSIASGPLYSYLFRLATALNEIPTFSFSSGNPNSVVTANIGAVNVNIASATTDRWWVKEIGSGDTGWSSLATN